MLYFLFLLIGFLVLVTQDKGKEIIFLNGLHTPVLDEVFKRTTQLAEAPLFLFILIVALRFSYGKGLVLLGSCSITFLIIQFLKKVVFETQVRPALFFEGKAELNFVQGVHIAYHYSFPSGHTAAAFSLFTMLALLVENKKWSLLFFVLALMVGVSRVYLLQHFLRDVYVGSFIGVTVSTVFYLTFVRSSLYQNLSWKDKSLFR